MSRDNSPILDASRRDPFAGAPTFSLAHRLVRALFALTWSLCCRWTPPQLRAWRILVLRIFGARIHSKANVYASTKIWYPPNLSMDEAATLGPGVYCYSMAPIHIGRKAIVSQRAHLCAGSHDVDDDHFQLVAAPIAISDYAWIAAEAFVGPGVTVGKGAVLGARSVTVKPLEDWSIYAGNPARKIRTRRGRPS